MAGLLEAKLLLADSKFHSQELAPLRTVFERSRHPMLIADDQRRWVNGNAAASELLGMPGDEVPWHTMDDFTPPSELVRLDEQWQVFLDGGSAEGLYDLYLRGRGVVPVEFSATANVAPGRHLLVLIPADEASTEAPEGGAGRAAPWKPVAAQDSHRSPLTTREREVMTLIACGLRNGSVAQQLFIAPETVKSHIRNAMGKLGASTRAHAVALALVTGQITPTVIAAV